MIKISCFIIAKNEEKHIAKAIKSVKLICDEIILVDSGSTDETIQIAENLGAKVVFNAWPGYLKQKIFGESLCQHEWILNIDADEELTVGLQEEIYHLALSGLLKKYQAYNINFGILYRDEDHLRRFAPSNYFIRLYNKNYASFGANHGDSTHDDVKLHTGISEKDTYKFENPALHRSGTSINQLVSKANFYSSEQANAMVRKGRSASKLRLIFEMPLWFLKAFIWRRYFIFGIDGFIDSMIFAFARFIRLAKLYEESKKFYRK